MTGDNALIPVSKATNAYELLDEVKALILEESTRYCQTTWIINDPETLMDEGLARPRCGTVACVAGWVAQLKAGPISHWDVLETAGNILGLDRVERYALFNGDAIGDLCGVEGMYEPAPQTPEYAELGAEHITRFQATHEAQLKAKAV